MIAVRVCSVLSDRSTYAKQFFNPLWLFGGLVIILLIAMDVHSPLSSSVTFVQVRAVLFIKKIVGHKGQGVTENVYTHIELPTKLEAINLI